MRLAWVTDIHLEFPAASVTRAFFDAIGAADCPLLVTGDISNAGRVESDLRALRDAAHGHPVYFVLGNHDYYGDSTAAVHERIAALTTREPSLIWLTNAGVIELNPTTCLIGEEGWGDFRYGDPNRAVRLNDDLMIDELRGADPRWKLQELAARSAAGARTKLDEALPRYKHIAFATHVPPFREACWHEGRVSGDDWLPRFTCAAVGDVLRQCLADRPEVQLTVYCGHSHGEGFVHIQPNIKVFTGGADYGYPRIQRILEF